MNGLLGTGDQLRLDGTVSYEHGGLVNGRLDYSQLVSGYGTRAGAAYSRLDYQYDFMNQRFGVLRRLGALPSSGENRHRAGEHQGFSRSVLPDGQISVDVCADDR